MAPDAHFLAMEDHVCLVNPSDQVALEMALRAGEAGKDAEVLLLTLGPLIAEADLRRCLAMGADAVYRIEVKGPLDAWGISGCLARASGTLGSDLILCGKESQDSQNGQVPAFLAHRLNRPFVSAITALSIQPGQGHATVVRRCGKGRREVIRCPLPAVLSADPGACSPRWISLAGQARADHSPIQTLLAGEEEIHQRVVVKRTFPPRPRPKKVFTPDSRRDAFTRIDQLLSGDRVEKKGVILAGDPDSQVEGILSFLNEHGFKARDQE